MGRPRNNGASRTGSVYVAVTGTAVLIAIMGFTALHISRLELRQATAHSEMLTARSLAHSGVEFAMGRIQLDNNWRSNYNHGDEHSVNLSGVPERLIFRFLDTADDDLEDDSTEDVIIQGIGRCGTSEYRYNVTYAPTVTSQGTSAEQVLKSFDTGTNTNEQVSASGFLGQYFIPDLPSDALSWSITHIDVYLEGHGSPSATMDFKLYTDDGSGEPGTLIESLAVPESSLPVNGTPAYHQFDLSTATSLTPGQGYCFTMEQTTGGNSAIVHYAGGATQTNSHLLRGGVGWWNSANNQSLQYRVYGTVTTPGGTGDFAISPGTWQRTVVP